jgi:MYXO-CTERM domain-containing protein
MRRVDASDEEVVLISGSVDGPLPFVPRDRPRAFERGGRIFAQSEGVVRPVDGLTQMTSGVHAELQMVFAARDVAGGEYAAAVEPRDAVGGPSPFGAWVGREPWVLEDDGAPRLVADLFPGPEGSNPAGFARLPDGGVVFHAMTPDRGRELWFVGEGGDAQPVCDLAEGPAPGIPVWAEIEVGPDALFVPAFVEGVGTEVVSVPFEAARGAARCVVVQRLAEAESGCGCRAAGGAAPTAVWGLLVMGLGFGLRHRRSRVARAG